LNFESAFRGAAGRTGHRRRAAAVVAAP